MENDREDLSFTTLGNTGGANETPFITVQHGGHVSEEVFKNVDVHLVKRNWALFQDRRSSQDDDDDHDGEGIETGELREQDRFLPIANVARIMKKAIPAQVSCSQRFKISSKPKNFS